MGCIKPNGAIKINKIESVDKINKNEFDQNKLIISYVSSSQCGDSDDESSKNSSKKNENISQNKNSKIEKYQKNEEEKS